MLRAHLFGALRMEIDGRPVEPIAAMRPRSLLAYLLLHPHSHTRDRLAGLFWPWVLDTSARASLRSALWQIRARLRAAGGEEYLLADRGTVALASDAPRWIDTEEFERLSETGDASDLRRASELAGEPLLSDLSDEWVLKEREEHLDRLLDVLRRLGEGAEQRGDLDEAVEWSRKAASRDPLRETSHGELIRRLALLGRRDEGLVVYRRLEARLAAELDIAPSEHLRALVEEAPAPRAQPRRSASAGRRSGPMLGREGPFGELRRAWDAARSGRGGVVVIEGEAGIGKSRLVEEIASVADGEGAIVACGTGLELSGAPPLVPWSEIVRDLVEAAGPPSPPPNWAGDAVRMCAQVETSWGVAPTRAAPSPDLERGRLQAAVTEMVGWCARRRPLLLVFEDAHCADATSVALLAYVSRRIGVVPALLVVTRRPSAQSADLDLVLHEIDRHAGTRVVTLTGLATEAVAEIARREAPALEREDVARVVAAVDGNPLLAREVARAVAAGAAAHEGVRAAVRPALSGLPVTARLLVDLTAAAARPLDLAEASQLVGADLLPDALEVACGAELLDPGAARQVRFTHSLVREACYAEIAPARARWLHGLLAARLRERGGAEPAEVARHRVLAGEREPARGDLVAASERAREMGALDDAVVYLREATTLGASGAAAAEVWMALADSEAHLGRRAQMEDAFQEALALVDEDSLASASAHAARGRWLRTTVCAPQDALRAYERALQVLDDTGVEAPELRALVWAGAAWAEAMAGDPERVDELAAAAESVPEASDDAALHAEIALARAGAQARRGAFADAERSYSTTATSADAAGRPDLAHVSLANAASAAACQGGFDRALKHAERARGVPGAGPALETFTTAARAYALSRLGRHAEALVEVAEEAVLADRSGESAIEAAACLDRGAVALAAGRTSEAAMQIAEALASDGGTIPRPHARLLRAEALLAVDLDAAEAELRRVPFEPIGPADLPATLVPRLSRLQGLIAALRGDPDLALRRLGEAEDGWRRHLDLGAGDVFAATLVDLGRPPVAGLIEPALELGRVLADRASVLASAGRMDEARAAAAEAADLADEVGSDSYRHRLAAFAPA